ncbi:MAG TPA: hypothetical protein VG104_11280, partial [Candidatus Dormibacteraeota bacterium]|nr:hypothetical protein [Candidatus Dormibacteraeota bacterium]
MSGTASSKLEVDFQGSNDIELMDSATGSGVGSTAVSSAADDGAVASGSVDVGSCSWVHEWDGHDGSVVS